MSWGCLSKTHRKNIPGGSTPASMRVTVLANSCLNQSEMFVNHITMHFKQKLISFNGAAVTHYSTEYEHRFLYILP